jgi:OmpA-OmpF porin, OOP family
MIRMITFSLCMFQLFIFNQKINAQVFGSKVKNKTTDKINQRVDTRTDEGIDKSLDEIEKGVNGLFKKKKKKQTGANVQQGNQDTANVSIHSSGFAAYSKYDFMPGATIIAFDDFSQDVVGDFPAKWNTNSSGEVVTIEGSKDRFLLCKGDGLWYPEYLGSLPENATIEFDLVIENANFMRTDINFINVNANKNLLYFNNEGLTQVILHPEGNTEYFVNDLSANRISGNSKQQTAYRADPEEPGTLVHISIWKQKSRLRIYINEEKIWDIPKAFDETQPYRFVLGSNTYFLENRKYYISNLRAAIGLPDTRNKLITEGKYVTSGIRFQFQQASVSPESYAVLKEIATVLKENQNIKVRIVGHTSADGSETANLQLSKERAMAIKTILVKEFGIAPDRMETDGKGGIEPIDTGTTPESKANNRRVEFIKL